MRGYGIVAAVVVVVQEVRGAERSGLAGRWKRRRLWVVVSRGGGRRVGVVVVRGVEDWIGTMGRRRLLKK